MSNRLRLTLFSLFLAALLCAAPEAQAQRVRPDARVGLFTGSPITASLGGGAVIPLPSQFFFNPMGELVFGGSTSLLISADAGYDFTRGKAQIEGWAGAGLGVIVGLNSGGGSAVGLNLFGGVGFPSGAIMPYVQPKIIISNGTSFQIAGGIRF